MTQREPPSFGSLIAHIAIAWLVIVGAWWVLYPHPRTNHDLKGFVIGLVPGLIVVVLAYRKKR
jgi:hypothetical protein